MRGAGGEAERNPDKDTRARLHRVGQPSAELAFPALLDQGAAAPLDLRGFREVQLGDVSPGAAESRIVATIALALCALQDGVAPAEADRRAGDIWRARARPREDAAGGRPNA